MPEPGGPSPEEMYAAHRRGETTPAEDRAYFVAHEAEIHEAAIEADTIENLNRIGTDVINENNPAVRLRELDAERLRRINEEERNFRAGGLTDEELRREGLKPENRPPTTS